MLKKVLKMNQAVAPIVGQSANKGMAVAILDKAFIHNPGRCIPPPAQVAASQPRCLSVPAVNVPYTAAIVIPGIIVVTEKFIKNGLFTSMWRGFLLPIRTKPNYSKGEIR
jgi:hypothetical protein